MKAGIGTAAIVLAGTLACGSAFAQSMVYGFGTASCGSFVTYSRDTQLGYMDWLSGYATMTSSRYDFDYFKGTDTNGRLLWIKNYCQAHPLETFSDATIALLVELRSRQQ